MDLEINMHKRHHASHSTFHFEEVEKLMSNRGINSTRAMKYWHIHTSSRKSLEGETTC